MSACPWRESPVDGAPGPAQRNRIPAAAVRKELSGDGNGRFRRRARPQIKSHRSVDLVDQFRTQPDLLKELPPRLLGVPRPQCAKVNPRDIREGPYQWHPDGVVVAEQDQGVVGAKPLDVAAGLVKGVRN